MKQKDWGRGFDKYVAQLLNGYAITAPNAHG